MILHHAELLPIPAANCGLGKDFHRFTFALALHRSGRIPARRKLSGNVHPSGKLTHDSNMGFTP